MWLSVKVYSLIRVQHSKLNCICDRILYSLVLQTVTKWYHVHQAPPPPPPSLGGNRATHSWAMLVLLVLSFVRNSKKDYPSLARYVFVFMGIVRGMAVS